MHEINIIIKEAKKAGKYYGANKEFLREDERNKYTSLKEKQ